MYECVDPTRAPGEREAEAKAREAQWRDRDEQLRAIRSEQERREGTFMALVHDHGEAFIEACNAAIHDTWQRLAPAWPTGRRKGQPREVPFLQLTDGKIKLYSGTGDGGRKVRTPISRVSFGELRPLWSHPAWSEGAVPALTEVIARFSSKHD